MVGPSARRRSGFQALRLDIGVRAVCDGFVVRPSRIVDWVYGRVELFCLGKFVQGKAFTANVPGAAYASQWHRC
ncbi:hypothetical protein GCM10010199_53230 [Dactylosporangium roseum]